jgi:ATP/maltotriose-dependent transcriptional regulator MalT
MWMTEEDAAGLVHQLLEAVRASDWQAAVAIIEMDWPMLMRVAVPALDTALRALPEEAWASNPTVAAVREIRLNVPGDTAGLDRIAASARVPSQPAELREVARGAGARRAMGVAAAFMLAYRAHGQHRKALHFAAITEELARRARVSRPQEFSIRVPSALLQIGITRMLAGDYHQAIVNLREAYELRDQTWDGRVGSDAAGILALLFAVRGDTVEAERWLARRGGGVATGWMVPLVQLSARTSAALIAVDRLDQTGADSALSELESPVIHERAWASFVTFAHARYALYWGDQHAALERIDRSRASTGQAHRHAGIEPRLDAVKANLLLAVDRPAEARALSTEREGDVHLAAVAARLALMQGRADEARKLAATGLAIGDLDSRTQIDLLTTCALAEESPESGRRFLRQAIATSVRTGVVAPFALAPRSSLRKLVGTMTSSLDNRWFREQFSAAPQPVRESIDIVELTSTEHLVLQYLADGLSRPTIAKRLFVSDNTVKFHVRNLYRKLGVASRTAAVAKGHQLRLLSGSD